MNIKKFLNEHNADRIYLVEMHTKPLCATVTLVDLKEETIVLEMLPNSFSWWSQLQFIWKMFFMMLAVK